MKKITLTFLSLCFTVFLGYGQNLVTNGDFEVGEPGDPIPSWGGFKNRIANDDITSAKVGQIENGDGSLFQEFAVTPGETYNVSLEYRWVASGGASGSALTIRVKDASDLPFNLPLIDATAADGYTLDTALDTWLTATFSFEVPAGINNVRFLMFKPNGNKPLNIDNVEVTTSLSTNNLTKFDFGFYPNPVKDMVYISANEAIDKVEIFNIAGRKVNEIRVGINQSQFSMNSLPSGIYIMKTFIGNTIGTSKLIKQ